MGGDILQCELCFRSCVIMPGGRGNCRVRYNLNGELVSLVYGKPCAVHVDPIEKKPLYHFLPGTKIFSIATVGCNNHCVFCQNWEISQAKPEDVKNEDLPPDAVAENAVSSGCKSVAYTYTEPSVFYEYAYDSSVAAKKRGLKNVLVTAGSLNEKPARELLRQVDAATINIKGNEEFYQRYVHSSLKQTQNYIKFAIEEKVFVELVNLIIPTLNDKKEDVEWVVKWILDTLGPNIPLHFLRFHPMYKLVNLYPTAAETLLDAARMSKDMGLKYVYVGNLPSDEFEHTRCPKCGELLIERHGFLKPDVRLKNGSCPKCGEKIPGIWR